MSRGVRRLPVQHPRSPHCPTCEAPLPSLDSMIVSFAEDELKGCDLLAVKFRLRCPCGSVWDLLKVSTKEKAS